MKPYEIVGVKRPTTRAECVDGPRPCPWVSCRHHLLLEIAHAKPRKDDRGKKRDARPTTIRLNRETPGQVGRRAGLHGQTPAEIVRAWMRDAVEHLDQMPHTCALDVVDAHPDGMQLTDVAALLGVTGEALRDASSMSKFADDVRKGLSDYADHVPADRESNLSRIGATRGANVEGA